MEEELSLERARSSSSSYTPFYFIKGTHYFSLARASYWVLTYE